MQSIRFLIAAIAVFVALGAAPAFAQQEMTGDNAPAIVLEEPATVPTEAAWTFRFLVPTLVGVTGIAILIVALGYGIRVRGRYRVIQ